VIALLDADLISYRSAAACKDESVKTACYTADGLVVDALLSCDYEDLFYDRWQLYLTGKGNFREAIATTAPYKGNRITEKPAHLYAVRDHLVEQWGAIVVEGQEADDAIAIAASKDLSGSVIVSVDKDFMQVPTHIYNFLKREHHFVTELEGLRSFYKQMLTGDSVDNIIGIRGIGKVKADKLLAECTSESEMYAIVRSVYANNEQDEQRIIENGRLLWLRRKEGQIWNPPNT